MNGIAKTIIAGLSCAWLMSATALANPDTAADPAKAADAPAVTTGSVDVEPSFEQRMQECMAIWEPRTHMTKSEWRRSCKTTLKSLTN
jgi:hypothetical protein